MFSFNFLVEQLDKDHPAAAAASLAPRLDDSNTTPTTTTDSKEPRLPFHWIDENVLEKLLTERTQEEIVFSEIGLTEEDGLDPLRCVDLSLSSFQKSEAGKDITTTTSTVDDCRENPCIPESLPVWHSTDIQPGVYEGGRKIWEASLDLLHFLIQTDVTTTLLMSEGNFIVLELGCGHGLPLIYLLRQSLEQKEKVHSRMTAVFTDYNDSVILDATLSNIVLNCCTSPLDPKLSVNNVTQHIVMGAGDWLDMSYQLLQDKEHNRFTKLPPDSKFDLILAAETMYSERSARETAILLQRHLKESSGIAYVATKRYYFGVGGGVDAFRQHGEKQGLEIESMRVHDDGSSNIREILRVKLKQ